MFILWILNIVLASLFVAIVRGAPYLPTLNKQIAAALDLVDLKEGQVILELGSGDGRVLIAAAKRGIKSIGYEINPLLVAISYMRTIRYRKLVTIVWADFWKKDWPKADGVFVFLIDRYMKKLDKTLVKYPFRPIKLVSFAFEIPHKKIVKSKDGIHLYLYK